MYIFHDESKEDRSTQRWYVRISRSWHKTFLFSRFYSWIILLDEWRMQICTYHISFAYEKIIKKYKVIYWVRKILFPNLYKWFSTFDSYITYSVGNIPILYSKEIHLTRKFWFYVKVCVDRKFSLWENEIKFQKVLTILKIISDLKIFFITE